MGGTRLTYLFESTLDSNALGMEDDFSGKIKYDDSVVFRRLRVDDVQDELVAGCAAALRSGKMEEIKILKNLTRTALGEAVEDLEEVKYDSPDDSDRETRSGKHGCAEEVDMNESLVRLLNYIANFNQNDPPRRVFYRTNGMLKPAELHTFGFTSVTPEITISPTGLDASNSRKWQDRDAFCVIRPSKKQSPIPAAEGELPAIVTQAARYARLFMSSRPFMLYCVGILIFGTEVCVGIFDRDEITFSPIHDMFRDIEIFVRVVRSFGCTLSIEELGHDSSVRVLSNAETKELTGESDYPSAVIFPIGEDLRQWCTLGPPIWVSFSLLGHGTHVWIVREYVEGDDQQPYLQGKKMIMKSSWRSSARKSESDIYLSIEQPTPKGLAKFECGGDVTMFCGPAQHPISIYNLRSANSDKVWLRELTEPMPVLHRLILSTVGRPMWEYQSDLELLSGFRDALEAHKALCKKGILHRDISAGNVFLDESPKTESCGFIADLEFARIESPSIPETTAFAPADEFKDTTVYGTAQFMARELLYCKTSAGDLVIHEAKHDVESFIWVLSYAVMRNLYIKASNSDSESIREQCGELGKLFRRAFCQKTFEEIAEQRQTESAVLGFPFALSVKEIIDVFMTKALVDLFRELQNLLYSSSRRASPPLILIHDVLLAKVNNAIALLLLPCILCVSYINYPLKMSS